MLQFLLPLVMCWPGLLLFFFLDWRIRKNQKSVERNAAIFLTMRVLTSSVLIFSLISSSVFSTEKKIYCEGTSFSDLNELKLLKWLFKKKKNCRYSRLHYCWTKTFSFQTNLLNASSKHNSKQLESPVEPCASHILTVLVFHDLFYYFQT